VKEATGIEQVGAKRASLARWPRILPHSLRRVSSASVSLVGHQQYMVALLTPARSATSSMRFSCLLDVCRLRLRLLDLLHRLGGSLVDVEGELDVVVVDPNAIVRLQRSAQQQP
jgi:hypothetical protein